MYRSVSAFFILAAMTASACTRTSAALSPTAATSADAIDLLTGTVTATNGGQAVAGASVATLAETVTTNADGAFEFHAVRGGRAVPLTISGPSIVTRTTMAGGSSSDALTPKVFMQNDGGFDLGFYRALARNGYEQPSQLQPIRRWTRAPQIYLKTVDEAGLSIDAVTLDSVSAALADAAGIWSGGAFGLAGITRGTSTREGTAGWITVKFANPPAAGRCGLTQIGVEGGWMELNYLGATCSCGGPSKIYPRLVRHELGHAFGFYHTDSADDVMYGQAVKANTCNLQPSTRERQYAKYMYSRPVGNVDPDTDPVSALSPARILPAIALP
jgi:hypothetical protein